MFNNLLHCILDKPQVCPFVYNSLEKKIIFNIQVDNSKDSSTGKLASNEIKLMVMVKCPIIKMMMLQIFPKYPPLHLAIPSKEGM